MGYINRSYEICSLCFGEDFAMETMLEISRQIGDFKTDDPHVRVYSDDYGKPLGHRIELSVGSRRTLTIKTRCESDYTTRPGGAPFIRTGLSMMSCIIGMVYLALGSNPIVGDTYVGAKLVGYPIWYPVGVTVTRFIFNTVPGPMYRPNGTILSL